MTRLKTWAIATTFILAGNAAFAETDLETAINNGGEMNRPQFAGG